MQDKPWENQELRRWEEALPRLKEGDSKDRSRMWRLPSPTSFGFDKKNERINCGILEKVEQSCKWPQQACTTMFFLFPKNVTSERPIALIPTLIRWWVGWDETDGRNGGAQQTMWENLMEMDRFNGDANAEDQGAVPLVLSALLLFRAPEEGTFRRSAAERCGASRSSCQGPSGVACYCALCCRIE